MAIYSVKLWMLFVVAGEWTKGCWNLSGNPACWKGEEVGKGSDLPERVPHKTPVADLTGSDHR